MGGAKLNRTKEQRGIFAALQFIAGRSNPPLTLILDQKAAHAWCFNPFFKPIGKLRGDPTL